MTKLQRVRVNTERGLRTGACFKSTLDTVADAQQGDLTRVMARVADGDRQAFNLLYTQTFSRVYRCASRLLRCRADTEEVVSEVYSIAWRNAATYLSSRGAVEVWLMTICRSRSIDRIRSNARFRRHASHDPYATWQGGGEELTGERMLSQDQVNRLQGAIADLSPIKQDLLRLAFIEELPHSAIARRRHLAIGTVKSHIRRALRSLSSQMAEMRPNSPVRHGPSAPLRAGSLPY